MGSDERWKRVMESNKRWKRVIGNEKKVIGDEKEWWKVEKW